MILDKDEFLKKSTLIYNSSYDKSLTGFAKMLRWSRMPFLKRNGFFMAIWQCHMLRWLVSFQEQLQKMEKQLQFVTNPSEKEVVERKILIERQWIRVVQTIADGIAWRTYSFNRPLLRLMSENSDPGHLIQADYDYPHMLRRLLMSAPHLRILNDITRVLRIGDITVFYPGNKPIIYEVKKKGRKVTDTDDILKEMKKHSRYPTAQENRHLVAQMAIINNRIDVPVFEKGIVTKRLIADVLDLDFPIMHHFEALKRLIKKADKDVYAGEVVDEGHYIDVLAADKLNENNIDKIMERRTTSPDWVRSSDDSIITISNFDSFMDSGKEYPRNIIPYSILPLSAVDCTRLMTGHLQVSVYVDMKVFRKKLIDRGWDVTDADPYQNLLKVKQTPARNHMFESDYDDTLYYISRREGGATYNSGILLTHVFMMVSSFYGWNFLLDAADAMFEHGKAKKETRLVVHNYVNEKKILR